MRPVLAPWHTVYARLTTLSHTVQCIGEAFGVDPNDQAQVERLSVKPANLLSIFDVFLKTKDKLASPSGSAAAAAPSAPAAPSAADKAAAEKLKATGNAQMSSKKYDDAIKSLQHEHREVFQLARNSMRRGAKACKGNQHLAAAFQDLPMAIRFRDAWNKSQPGLSAGVKAEIVAEPPAPNVGSNTFGS